MKLDLLKEDLDVAAEKWREYTAAVKKHKGVPMYKDLKKVYYQMKKGKMLIDITKIIPAGGVHAGNNTDNSHMPKLAIALATQRKVECAVSPNGSVSFRCPDLSWKVRDRVSIDLRMGTLPGFKWTDGNTFRRKECRAPVPIIPPNHMPDKLNDNHYILWEVDEWKMVPPTDPWLLYRITKTVFVVLAGWDLTPLEKTIMAASL